MCVCFFTVSRSLRIQSGSLDVQEVVCPLTLGPNIVSLGIPDFFTDQTEGRLKKSVLSFTVYFQSQTMRFSSQGDTTVYYLPLSVSSTLPHTSEDRIRTPFKVLLMRQSSSSVTTDRSPFFFVCFFFCLSIYLFTYLNKSNRECPLLKNFFPTFNCFRYTQVLPKRR